MTLSFKLTSLLLLVAACGCDSADAPDRSAARRARAAFALAEAERAAPDGPDEPAPDPDDRRPDPNCPRCHGSGTVPSGDGLARVPCACVSRSRHESRARQEAQEAPDRAAPAALPNGRGSRDASASTPASRVLVFTSKRCPSCAAMKPALAAAGAGFELIDVDADPRTAAAFGVTAVPTLIRLVDGRETARASGARDVSALRRFRDGGE